MSLIFWQSSILIINTQIFSTESIEQFGHYYVIIWVSRRVKWCVLHNMYQLVVYVSKWWL